MSGSHHHDHGCAHDHAAGADARALGWALAITLVVLAAEVAGAVAFNSLALLSDAGHMATDAAALAIALMAVRIGRRPADARRTFGYKRLETLAAGVNALLLLGVAGYVMVEAARRLIDPQPVAGIGMLAVAVLCLIANLVAMRLLTAGRERTLNMKGAYLEVWADALGSVGVIVGALVILATGWTWVDPLVAAGIALWVLPRAITLLRAAGNVLMEGVPPRLALDEVRGAILSVPGVGGVHDLHLWAVGSDEANLSAHVELADGDASAADADAVRARVAAMLARRFGVDHATIQVEAARCEAGVVHL